MNDEQADGEPIRADAYAPAGPTAARSHMSPDSSVAQACRNQVIWGHKSRGYPSAGRHVEFPGFGVAPSGYYEWLKQPVSNRAQEDAGLVRLMRAAFTASHGIYGAPRVFLDLRESGETCSKHRVARLMRENGLRALHGYHTRRWSVGRPAVLIPNLLQRQFTVTRPNRAWVTDITSIRT
jgi:HTH-like domain